MTTLFLWKWLKKVNVAKKTLETLEVRKPKKSGHLTGSNAIIRRCKPPFLLAMPRNQVERAELEVRVLKIKNELYNGTHMHRSGDWHDGAHMMLNRILDILQEYHL